MRKQLFPITLWFVAFHGENVRHGVVDTLDAVISAGVVRLGVDLVYSKTFAGDVGELQDTLRPVFATEGDGGSPQRYVPVD